jgi:hypothetical protein
MMSSVVKSASFRNVPRPKSRLYESVSPSTRSNSGAQPSSLVAFWIDAKKCCRRRWLRHSASVTQTTARTSHNFRHMNRGSSASALYLVSEWEGLLLAEVVVLGVVVDELWFRESSSLQCIVERRSRVSIILSRCSS